MKDLFMHKQHRVALVFNETYFCEFAEACSNYLRSCGFETALLREIPVDGEWSVVLVIGIHKYLRVPFMPKTKFLGVQTEQLPLQRTKHERLNRNLNRFRAVRHYYQLIFEWNPSLEDAGIGGEVFVPYGCRPKYCGQHEKKWDVVFIGNVHGSDRRQEILGFLKSRFNFYPDFSPGFAERKDEAINGSRVCLNIHYYQDCGFESPRVYDYLSHGGFILSDRVPSTKPFVVGIDLDDFGDKYELADKLESYLENEALRKQIAEHGFKTATHFDFNYTGRIIELEIEKIVNCADEQLTKLVSWGNGRLRSEYLEFRDYLSLTRRRIFTLDAK